MEGDRERCIDAGCDDYATKPIDRLGLIRLIQQYLNQTAADPATASPADSTPLKASPEKAEVIPQMEKFVESLPAQIRAIEETIANGNWELLQALVEDLQAGAIESGALTIHSAAGALEHTDDLARIQEKLDELTSLCQQAATDSTAP